MCTPTQKWSYCSLKVCDWSIRPSLRASAILAPSGPNVLRDDKIDWQPSVSINEQIQHLVWEGQLWGPQVPLHINAHMHRWCPCWVHWHPQARSSYQLRNGHNVQVKTCFRLQKSLEIWYLWTWNEFYTVSKTQVQCEQFWPQHLFIYFV